MIIDELNTICYSPVYGNTRIRGIDDPSTPRPWDLEKILSSYLDCNTKLLDIGCGTGIKIIPFSDFCKQIVGIDINSDMINAAKKLITVHVSKIVLAVADGYALPFQDNTFDMVTCMLSRWSIPEISRVLKPGGHAIIEHIGPDDKKELKTYFGKDPLGWRGQKMNETVDECLQECQSSFVAYFDSVSIKNGYWDTFYDYEGLVLLLNNTPTIRNFNMNADSKLLKRAFSELSFENLVRLRQNRILIHVTAPKK